MPNAFLAPELRQSQSTPVDFEEDLVLTNYNTAAPSLQSPEDYDYEGEEEEMYGDTGMAEDEVRLLFVTRTVMWAVIVVH